MIGNYGVKMPRFVGYLGGVFVLFLAVFNLFRYVLLKGNEGRLDADSVGLVNDALWLGCRYDVMLVSYILALPFVVYCVGYWWVGKRNLLTYNKWLVRGVRWFMVVCFVIVVLAGVSDIPYYQYFNTRITKGVWNWVDSPGIMLEFVFGTKAFYPYLLMIVLLLFAGIWTIVRLSKKLGLILQARNEESSEKISTKKNWVWIGVLAVLLFWGTRGGALQRPLAMRDAFTCNNAFVNVLPLNPVHSYLNSINFTTSFAFTEDEAIGIVQGYYGIKQKNVDSPVARKIEGIDSVKEKKHVFLILIESLYYDMAFGKDVMPYMKELREKSVSYENTYSCGIHTHNGLYGALYGFPTIPGVHPFSNNYASVAEFSGIGKELKNKGYSSNFYCTHEKEFDNLGYFLPKNGYDKIYCRGDYPPDKMVNNWGISDEYLYEYCLDRCKEMQAKANQPMLNVVMSISSHQPAELPFNTSFKTNLKDKTEQVYAYSDWCLGNFMAMCSKEDWFTNSLFVIIGDHGINTDDKDVLEMPMSVHHIPFLVYEPGKEKEAKKELKIASQLDVFPTIMGKLGLAYINNCFGIDLSKETRKNALFISDDRVGVINENYLYVDRNIGGEALFELKKDWQTNKINELQGVADGMHKYGYSIMQVANWMIEKGKTSTIKLPSEEGR
jgi:phosphoglycerol transferase MdoB-like AlkP superfamily enzyme